MKHDSNKTKPVGRDKALPFPAAPACNASLMQAYEFAVCRSGFSRELLAKMYMVVVY
jgi:hypothetical protein